MIRTALLDVNVLVALFDPNHVHHEAAHAWFGAHRSSGWATCPLTENGLVRVLSSLSYAPDPIRPAMVRQRLRLFCDSSHHVFWPDDVSIGEGMFTDEFPITSRQITDVYLLALAVRHGGCLATMDRSIPHSAIAGVEHGHLALIQA